MPMRGGRGRRGMPHHGRGDSKFIIEPTHIGTTSDFIPRSIRTVMEVNSNDNHSQEKV